MIPGQCPGVSIKPPEKEVFGIAEFLCDVFQRDLVLYAQLTYSIIVHSVCIRQRCVVVLMNFPRERMRICKVHIFKVIIVHLIKKERQVCTCRVCIINRS